MKIFIIIACIISLIAFFSIAFASPPGKTVEFADGDQGKVIFKGDTHGVKQGMKCNDCHPKLFQMKKGTFKMTKEDHGKGIGCGACHDGKEHFGKIVFSQSDEANCGKCHVKGEAKTEESKPEEGMKGEEEEK
jgi:c(7)-type cytochrome triheme protein